MTVEQICATVKTTPLNKAQLPALISRMEAKGEIHRYRNRKGEYTVNAAPLSFTIVKFIEGAKTKVDTESVISRFAEYKQASVITTLYTLKMTGKLDNSKKTGWKVTASK